MKKYEYIARIVEQQMRSGKLVAGQRLPSIRQYTLRYKSSTYPIFQAMQELERRGCLVRRAGKGYYVATENRRRVLLLSTVREGAIDHYYDSFKEEAEAARVNYRIIVMPSRSAWRNAVSEARRWAPDEVLLDVEGVVIPFYSVRSLLKTSSVIFCNRFEWPDISTDGLRGVLIDQRQILRSQFNYLRERGCRRIRYVATQDELQPFLRKYLEALSEEMGISWGEDEFAIANRLYYFSPHWRRSAFHKLPDGLMGNDVSVFSFQQTLDTVFGSHPDIIKIGTTDSVWAHIAGHEFDSFYMSWRSIWQRALSGEVTSVEYIQPELHHNSTSLPQHFVITGANCQRVKNRMHFQWNAEENNAFYQVWVSQHKDFSRAYLCGSTVENTLDIPADTIQGYSFWRVTAITSKGRSACTEYMKILNP